MQFPNTMYRFRHFLRTVTLATTSLLSPMIAADDRDGVAENEQPLMRAIATEDGVVLVQSDIPILRYQRTTKSLGGSWPRAAYVHPLYDEQGSVITEDFPADHRHHRGIFWAWHQVWIGDKQVGDPWACKDFVWDVTKVETTSSKNTVTLLADVQWKSPLHVDSFGAMIPIVRETTKITAHATEETYRLVDFEISLIALVEDLRIGGSDNIKGYGGFSTRIVLTDDLKFRASDGEVEPVTTAIAAGDWIDIASEDRGIAILTHPANPGTRGRWILRRKTSMQNAVYPGRTPVTVSTRQPTVLRYRLVIHHGKFPADLTTALQRSYDKTP